MIAPLACTQVSDLGTMALLFICVNQIRTVNIVCDMYISLNEFFVSVFASYGKSDSLKEL